MQDPVFLLKVPLDLLLMLMFCFQVESIIYLDTEVLVSTEDRKAKDRFGILRSFDIAMLEN